MFLMMNLRNIINNHHIINLLIKEFHSKKIVIGIKLIGLLLFVSDYSK
jgi:hypothetical protein